MSNKTKLVQRQAHCHCTAVPAFTGLFSADDGDKKTSLTLSQKWPPLGGSGDACLVGLRAASGLGLGRRWQAGRQEGRLAKEEGGKKKRERHGTPGGSRLPTTPAPRQLVLSSASRAFSITSCRYRQLKESAGGGGGGGGGGGEGMALMAFSYEIELPSAVLLKSFSPTKIFRP